MHKQIWLGPALAILSVLLWCPSAWLIKLLLEQGLGPAQIAAVRGGIAAPVMALPLLYFWTKREEMQQPHTARVLLVGVLYAAAGWLFAAALAGASTPTVSVFFYGTPPVVMFLLSLRKESLFKSLRSLDALAVFAIMVLLPTFFVGRLGWSTTTAIFCCFGCGLTWSFSVAIALPLRQRITAFALGCVLLGLTSLSDYSSVWVITWEQWQLLICVGVLALGIPSCLLLAALAVSKHPTPIMVIMSMQAVLASALVFWQMGENPGAETYIAGILTVGAIVVYTIARALRNEEQT